MANKILSNLLSFDKMISEQIIKIVYYVGLLAIAFGFIASVWGAFQSGLGGFIPALLMAIVGAALAILLWRVFCECIIILFRMYARLGDINKTLGGKNVEAAIPGDEVLKAAREAALNTKNAALERADALKSKLKKDDHETPDDAPKPAAAPPVRPAPVKAAAKTASAKKTPVKKTTAAKKSPAKTSAAKKPAAKKTTPKK